MKCASKDSAYSFLYNLLFWDKYLLLHLLFQAYKSKNNKINQKGELYLQNSIFEANKATQMEGQGSHLFFSEQGVRD